MGADDYTENSHMESPLPLCMPLALPHWWMRNGDSLLFECSHRLSKSLGFLHQYEGLFFTFLFYRKMPVFPSPNKCSCLTSIKSQGAWETWSYAVLRQVRLRQPFPAPGRLSLSEGESPLPPQQSPGKAWVTTVKIISYAEFMACWVGLHCVVSEVWKQKPVICGMTFFLPSCVSQLGVQLRRMPSAGLVLNSFPSFHVIYHSCNM